MPENLDALAKAKARALKRELEQQQAEERLRRENARIRKLERELSTRRATMLGETIRDAELTRDEKVVIGRILARRKEVPKDWPKISDFLTAAHTPVDEAIGEFLPVGRKITAAG
jgi:hypothetical protein